MAPNPVSDNDVLARFPGPFNAATLQRGRAYAAEGRVRIMRVERSPGEIHVEAEVQGTRKRPYEVDLWLEVDQGGAIIDIDNVCMCPMQENCKHVVAVLLTLGRTTDISGLAGHLNAPLPQEAEYPAERVEEITSIPAKTIRRIAREFGEAARIGATVKIDGVDVPYRPVNVEWMRGPQGHTHAWHHSWALTLMNLVMGASGVVGSGHATDVGHNWPIKSWPEAGEDGMLQNRGSAGRGVGNLGAFPGRTVTRPGRWDLFELFPVARHTRTLVPEVFKDSGKYGIDHKIELLIHTSANYVMGGWGDTQAVVDWYKSIDLVVGFAVEIHETHELDDIVLPMPTYLEENAFHGSHVDTGVGDAVAGDHVGFHHIQQAVLKAPEGVRSPIEVLMEIYHRAGILDEICLVINRSKGLKPPYLLEAGKRYTETEILDRHAKSLYGEDKGWD